MTRKLDFDNQDYRDLGRALALGMVNGPYTFYSDEHGSRILDIGQVTQEVIDSDWLAEVRRKAAEEGWNAARMAVKSVPHWYDPEAEYGEFDLQPLGPNETSEDGAFMEVMRELDANPYKKGEPMTDYIEPTTPHARDHLGICQNCGEGLSVLDIVDGQKPCPGPSYEACGKGTCASQAGHEGECGY
jgi:hypothetical protein